MRQITEAEFTEALEKAVSVKGEDYVYGPTNCIYRTPEGAPSCLIGHVLYHLDPNLLDFAGKWENVNVGGVLRAMARDGVATVPARVVRAAAAAQRAQDSKEPWGWALGTYRCVVEQAS